MYEALDFLALLSFLITDRWERRVITCGYWSNKSRGMRKKQQISEELLIIEPVLASKAYRKRWAVWIKKIWNEDPLTCPRCGAMMDTVAFILQTRKIFESRKSGEKCGKKFLSGGFFLIITIVK